MGLFNDDVSSIPKSGCNVVNSKSVIYNYNNGVRSTFTEIGGKWIKTGETTYSYNPNGLVCITNTELENFSSYSYMTPVFYMVAFFLFICSVILFVKSTRGVIYGR